MIRTCAAIAFFTARMITAVFDLETPNPPAGLEPNRLVVREPIAEQPPTIISGLPQDAGTLRR